MENKRRFNKETRRQLPSSIVLFLITIASTLIPPRRAHWLLLAIDIAYAVAAAVHDYKKDGKFTSESVICIIVDALCVTLTLFIIFCVL